MDIAIQTHNLCKSYVKRRVLLPTLFRALRQKWVGPQPSSVGSVPAYALQQISIEVRQGERLGIIGGSLLSGVAGYLILRWALPDTGSKGASEAVIE